MVEVVEPGQIETSQEWCPECEAPQAVEEVTEESVVEYEGEYGVPVAWLSCGHSVQWPGRRFIGQVF